MARFCAACVQLNSGNDSAANVRAAVAGIRKASDEGAQLILLPEYVALLDGSGRVMRERSHPEASHPALAQFQACARETGTWLLVGSLTVLLDEASMANRSYLLSDRGEIVAFYDKLHMFDVTLPSGKAIRESSAYRAGDRAVVAATPWGLMGMSICYDLRFPRLYRDLAQAGAQFLVVPSSFQRETGGAHWHALLRARAVENLSYVLAPAMCGDHPNGRSTYGHSLIIDPWGRILAESGEEPGVIMADIDTDEVARVRGLLPSLRHDREYGVSLC